MSDDALIAAVANALGAHALAWFVAGLCTVLTGATLLWWSAGRWLRPRDGGRLSPTALAALRFALGFALIVLAAWAFASIADELDAGQEMGRFDEAFTQALARHVDRPTLRFFAAATRLGDTLTVVLLCVVVALALMLRGRRALAAAWVVAVAGNGLLNETLKQVFERVRPLHTDGLVQAQGFSFPSGHSSGSVVAYGMLAWLLTRTLPARWHLPAVLAACLVAFTVGSSRVFLRVHYASDVAAGFAGGTAWLAVCIVSAQGLQRLRKRGAGARDR